MNAKRCKGRTAWAAWKRLAALLWLAVFGLEAEAQGTAPVAAPSCPAARKDGEKPPPACLPAKPALPAGGPPERLLLAFRLIYLHAILPR